MGISDRWYTKAREALLKQRAEIEKYHTIPERYIKYQGICEDLRLLERWKRGVDSSYL